MDSRPNSRNKAALSNFFGMVWAFPMWTLPESPTPKNVCNQYFCYFDQILSHSLEKQDWTKYVFPDWSHFITFRNSESWVPHSLRVKKGRKATNIFHFLMLP